MRLIFLASGAFARPTLRWLHESKHDVPLVITQPARGSGRGRRMTRTPVRALADDLGIETLEAEDVNTPDVLDQMKAIEATLGVVVAFGQKLGTALLDIFPEGCVNLHASLLPKYRGAAPINWAIVRGEERSGCTIFRITDRMDAGPVLISRWTAIKPEETAGELHDRLAGVGVDAVDAALALFADGASPAGTPQDEATASRAPKLRKADGAIRFDQTADEVASHILGMTPWPGARARFEGSDGRWETVTILRARRAEEPGASPIPPGTVDSRRMVAAADGFVEVLSLRPSSGREMTWQEYVNGRHVGAGDRFSTPDS